MAHLRGDAKHNSWVMQITFVIKFNISLLQIIGLCGYKKKKKKEKTNQTEVQI